MNYREEFQPVLQELFEEIQETFNRLSKEGVEQVNIAEQDIVTEVDHAITELVQSYFEARPQDFYFESEELHKSERPESEAETDYTVVFDEIDGTANMKDKTGPFGPIIGIAEGRDPHFNDVVAAGFLNLKDGELFEAYKEEGAYLTEANVEKQEISANDPEIIEEDSIMRLIVDQTMLGKAPEISKNAWNHHCNDYGSTGQHIAWVADGRVDAFITGGYSYMPEKEKHTGEEIGPLYRLVEEAGGTVTDWNGVEIGDRKIGLESGVNHNIVVSANQSIANHIVENIIPEEYQ